MLNTLRPKMNWFCEGLPSNICQNKIHVVQGSNAARVLGTYEINSL